MDTIRGVKHVLWVCGRPWAVEFCGGPVVMGNKVPESAYKYRWSSLAA